MLRIGTEKPEIRKSSYISFCGKVLHVSSVVEKWRTTKKNDQSSDFKHILASGAGHPKKSENCHQAHVFSGKYLKNVFVSCCFHHAFCIFDRQVMLLLYCRSNCRNHISKTLRSRIRKYVKTHSEKSRDISEDVQKWSYNSNQKQTDVGALPRQKKWEGNNESS